MRNVDPYLAELSRTIDPVELGRRVRNARIAAGMTQAEVVGDDVTAAHMSRIESGHRRPDVGLLERMAKRMGTTLESILLAGGSEQTAELELAVDHAELALVSGDGQGALAKVDALTDELSAPRFTVLRRRALRVRAGALEAIGELHAAIVVLEELTKEPSPDATWLRSLIALCRCYRDSGEYSKAIAVGTKTQDVIEELGIAGLTEAIQLTVTVASAYHRLGDVGEAMRTCMRAIQAAELFDSPIAQASAYWNASTFRADTEGATPEVIGMAKKALALFELGEDNRNLAKLRAEIAYLLLAADPPEPGPALDVLAQAQPALEWSGASAWDVALIDITRARALLLLGDLEGAEEAVRRGRSQAPDSAPFLHATASAIDGQIAVQLGDVERGKELYREAVRRLTAAGADRGAAELWFELATLLTEVGDTEAALAAFRSAGASGGFNVRMPSRVQSTN